MSSKASVLIPAYNEAEKIDTTINTLDNLPVVEEIVVVDDGSQDNTAYLSRLNGAKVQQQEKNLGKGAALNQGVKYLNHDLLLLLDADLGASAQEARKLVRAVEDGKCDMAVGKFTLTQIKKGGIGLVKKLAQYGLLKLTGQNFSAPLSGQRALKREVLETVDQFAPGYGVEVALTIDVWRAGYQIKEVPVKMKHRETGKDLSGFWHRGQQFKDVLKVLGTRWKRGGK